jgi:hypothetical protein
MSNNLRMLDLLDAAGQEQLTIWAKGKFQSLQVTTALKTRRSGNISSLRTSLSNFLEGTKGFGMTAQ